MKFLELKCPPPIVMFVAAIVALLTSQRSGIFLQQQTHTLDNLAWPLVFLVAGIAIALAGVKEFVHYKTTVNPLHPEKSTYLVVTGIFQITRNPMYLGMLIVLLGWADFLDSIVAFIGPLIFFSYITLFQIQPEERIMQEHFGVDFSQYCASVRRWL